MKIIYIANVRMPTEKAHGIQIMKTCEAFALLGHDVELVVTNRKTDIPEDPFSYYGLKTRFPIHRLPVLDTTMYGRMGFLIESVTFACAVRYYLRNKTYDVLYSRDENILALQRNQFVWESHTGAWNSVARSVVRHAKKIIVISQGLKDFYIKKGVPAGNLVVAHDGIDFDQFAYPQPKEQARTRLGLPQDKRVAMYVGRLDGWKGTDTLLEASKLLPSHTVLAVIGGEPAQIVLLSHRYPGVRFLGFRPYRELSDNMVAADVLVLPNTGKDEISVKFTSPLKLFAYMISGIPIVASDLPSIREVVDEHSAILVSPDNAETLASGIVRALEENGTRAVRASARVKEYSWNHRAEHIVIALSGD